MNHGTEKQKHSNPREKTGFLSLITFAFTAELFKKGYKEDLAEKDIYKVVGRFRSTKLGNRLEQQWVREQEQNDPSIYRLLWACYGRYYLFLGFVQLTMKLALVMIQPMVLGNLVSYFAPSSKKTLAYAIFNGTVLIIVNVVYCTYAHNSMFWLMELGIRVKTAFSSLIYRKALKLTPSALSDISIGKLVTLITKDINSFDSAIIFLNDMWISVILLIVTSYLMYLKVGVATFAGVLFLVLIIPLQIIFGKLTSNLRIKASKLTDQRLHVTQETLSVIKIIKMYTWEKFFGLKISKAREEEIQRIRQIYFAKATSLIIGGLVINLTLYIIVMTYTSLGNNFKADVAYYLFSCLQTLRSSVTISIPIGIAQTAELVASAQRIKAVLTAEEHPQPPVVRNPAVVAPAIQMDNVSVRIKDKEILHNVSLALDSGLTMLTGRLGGGKSSIIKTILKVYPIYQGELRIQGSISYASEEPWLFPSTIKQNILFGQNYHPERYQRVLHVCGLEQDIEAFEDGDENLVDDRGTNLSKGQQARINLARAVYNESDIYLIDDCLSSLDAHVQDFVFNECIKEFLKDKIVVMISHNERQIRAADTIIAMEAGTIHSIMESDELPTHKLDEIIGEEAHQKPSYDIVDNIIKNEEEDTEETELLPKKSNIYSEEKKDGDVTFTTYREYFKAGGGFFLFFLIVLLFIGGQFGTSYSDKLVNNWFTLQQNLSEMKSTAMDNNTIAYKETLLKNSSTLRLYTIVIVTATVLIFIRTYAHFTFAGKSSIGLHRSMVDAVVNATMRFFDTRYIGNILNRFSKDLGTVDEILPLIFFECIRGVCVLIGIIILIATVNKYFLIPAKIIFTLLFIIRKLYLPTGRSLKRLEAATKSPVIGHFNSSLEGLATIRASNSQDKLVEEFDHHQDLYTSSFHMMQCVARAFAYSLDMLCNIFVAIIIITLLIIGKGTQIGAVGLAITQAMMLTGILQWIIRQWADLENNMTSVERILEFCGSEKENKTGQALENWPITGKIAFKDVCLSYGDSKQVVLNNISFLIKPGEKIGVVGRTGAGKSSLIASIFRLYPTQGTIAIDDVDIKTVSILSLRSNITIIPQDPVLFNGTIRSNIDPTSRYSDEEIWRAIESTELKPLIDDLDQEVTNGGLNYSSGQRQLLCLARAIIGRNKIVILDEATANMDPETDVLIYTTLQKNFSECTVITIAHRLHTVLYSDKVMVVDKGQIIEYDHPQVLLDNKKGMFYKLVEQARLI